MGIFPTASHRSITPLAFAGGLCHLTDKFFLSDFGTVKSDDLMSHKRVSGLTNKESWNTHR